MTIHNPNLNPAQDIYNAPTQLQYAIQSRNRTIPLNQAQGSGHVAANLGDIGVHSGAAQNVNVGGGVVSNSRRGNTRNGESARAPGQSVARSSNRGQSLNNGGGNGNGNGGANRGGASRNTNTALVVHAHAQDRQPYISLANYGQLQAQYPHVPYNHMHLPRAQIHLQGRHRYPFSDISINRIQPHTGGLLGTLAPYVPLTRTVATGIPRSIQGVNRLDYAPLIQFPVFPVPFGYPLLGNMVVNGWDSRWDGSGGSRGREAGSRSGRGRGMRDRRRK